MDWEDFLFSVYSKQPACLPDDELSEFEEGLLEETDYYHQFDN